MDLHTGTPLWAATDNLSPDFPQLEDSIACDVAVLGAGITGALLAHALSAAGLKTVVLERRQAVQQSTLASTGLLQYEIDTPLTELIDKVGAAHAVRAYRAGIEAIERLEVLVGQLADACQFSRRDTLYLASRAEDVAELNREFETRRHFGLDVRYLDEVQLADCSSIRAHGAIWSTGDAQVDPYRLTVALLRQAQRQGARIFAHSEARNVREVPHGIELHTPRGHVRASHVVYATGYEADRTLDEPISDLLSTYAVSSRPIRSFEGWPAGCLLWETARPYFYARQTPDGRAIIGGEDTPFADDHAEPGLIELKSRELIARFRAMFPAIEFEPDYQWAGTFSQTKDGMPYIGVAPGHDRVLYALGYGGNGITFSVVAASLITDLVLGRPNADAEVFRFGR